MLRAVYESIHFAWHRSYSAKAYNTTSYLSMSRASEKQERSTLFAEALPLFTPDFLAKDQSLPLV